MASLWFSWSVLVWYFLAAFTPLVSATDTLTIINHCTYPLWFWTVRPVEATPDEESTYVAPNGGRFVHYLETHPTGSGLVLKMRDLPYYATAPAGIVQVEYNKKPDLTWYDLSYIDCSKELDYTNPYYCPFAAGGVRMYHNSQSNLCPTIHCQIPGNCDKTYLRHGSWKGEPSWACAAGTDFFVETCVDGPGAQTVDPNGYSHSGPEQPWSPPEYNPLWDGPESLPRGPPSDEPWDLSSDELWELPHGETHRPSPPPTQTEPAKPTPTCYWNDEDSPFRYWEIPGCPSPPNHHPWNPMPNGMTKRRLQMLGKNETTI